MVIMMKSVFKMHEENNNDNPYNKNYKDNLTILLVKDKHVIMIELMESLFLIDVVILTK